MYGKYVLSVIQIHFIQIEVGFQRTSQIEV